MKYKRKRTLISCVYNKSRLLMPDNNTSDMSNKLTSEIARSYH